MMRVGQDMLRHLPSLVAWIKRALNDDGKAGVLIHCEMGVSSIGNGRRCLPHVFNGRNTGGSSSTGQMETERRET